MIRTFSSSTFTFLNSVLAACRGKFKRVFSFFLPSSTLFYSIAIKGESIVQWHTLDICLTISTPIRTLGISGVGRRTGIESRWEWDSLSTGSTRRQGRRRGPGTFYTFEWHIRSKVFCFLLLFFFCADVNSSEEQRKLLVRMRSLFFFVTWRDPWVNAAGALFKFSIYNLNFHAQIDSEVYWFQQLMEVNSRRFFLALYYRRPVIYKTIWVNQSQRMMADG
jgi:hypothetical protein